MYFPLHITLNEVVMHHLSYIHLFHVCNRLLLLLRKVTLMSLNMTYIKCSKE